MHYVIHADHKGKENVLMYGPMWEGDREYLRDYVIPVLDPLSDEDYINGPAGILHTLAHYSYVLARKHLYWCVEWGPGLLVMRFSPDGDLKYAMFRSPNPEFGGRKATRAELREWEEYQECEENYQYNLVFTPLDAEQDEDCREQYNPATQAMKARYDAAMAHVNELGRQLEERFGDDQEAYDQWIARCEQSPIWKGHMI